MNQIKIQNKKLKTYPFLEELFKDAYYPKFLVDKGKDILIELCLEIERKNPQTLSELYQLTHKATNKFNDLEEEFFENESEIETVARDAIGADFDRIAIAYGYDADIEELIATRNW